MSGSRWGHHLATPGTNPLNGLHVPWAGSEKFLPTEMLVKLSWTQTSAAAAGAAPPSSGAAPAAMPATTPRRLAIVIFRAFMEFSGGG